MNISDIIDLLQQGGIAIWPLLFLSILAMGTIIERIWFWSRVLLKEQLILDRIIEGATGNWEYLSKIARDNRRHPLGHFIYGPLRLDHPDPDVFHLALEAAVDDEIALMRKGDKLLEAVIALAPLLGLFGTVWGLIRSLSSIQISDLGTASTAGVTLGIGESLISTAVGLLVAITSLAFYRLFQAFLANQIRVFRKVASELEIIYRQRWADAESEEYPLSTLSDPR